VRHAHIFTQLTNERGREASYADSVSEINEEGEAATNIFSQFTNKKRDGGQLC